MRKLAETYFEKFHNEHEELYQNAISDKEAIAWLPGQIPLFSCDDKQVEETYYFRFWTFRKHLRTTPEGWVITEFLPQVGWSGKYNTIACPVGHHITEGRWLHDKSIIKDDIRAFLQPDRLEDCLAYTNTLIPCACAYCIDYGDKPFAEEIFAGLEQYYQALRTRHKTKYGLYWSHDNRDGMEYSISGDGLRPTINSYMYGAAKGMAALCSMLGNSKGAEYEAEAKELRQLIRKYLWDDADGFYKTVPMADVTGEADFSRTDDARNAKEEIGFIPWCYEGLTTPEQDHAYALLDDPAHFNAPYSITTADMAHKGFMTCTVRHECLWDGPVWPYATSQTLTGLYTLLGTRGSNVIDAQSYMKHLHTYAASQHLYKDGRVINWIDENQEPFTGQWIARDLILLDHTYKGKFAKERGADYNHSTFCDLVLSGACGIRITDGKLTVRPLANGTWRYFAVEGISVGNDSYSVYFDADGTKYGFGAQLTVMKNGTVTARGNDTISISI
ncbi:MAG: hypothetical protein MJ175_07210 [Clostridia bacterium]|nr:hypothetical protein [Clostridia bacterium]